MVGSGEICVDLADLWSELDDADSEHERVLHNPWMEQVRLLLCRAKHE